MTDALLRTPCEGSNLVGHPWWSDFVGAQIMCQLCGESFPTGTSTIVPAHDRVDIIAMLDQGRFG